MTPSKGVNLLFLSHTLPYPPDGGVFIRTYNILRILSRAYRVRLIAFDRTGQGTQDPDRLEAAREALGAYADVSVVPVPQAHSPIRYVADHVRSLLTGRVFTHYRHDEPRFRHLLKESLTTDHFPIIHVDSLDLVGFLKLLPPNRVILTHHNIESQLLYDRAKMERSRVLKAYVEYQASLQEKAEREWCPRVRLNVTMSDRDGRELRRLAPGSATITVPNGIDVQAIQPSPNGAEGLVCVGGLGWFPNLDALGYLCDEILPRLGSPGIDRPEMRWVGRATTEQVEAHAREGVELTGYVKDVYPHIARAACYVMPFRLGGGTRLKLLEAMAAGKAIVTTSVGCRGVDVQHGRDVLIADTASEFSDCVKHVLDDPALRRRLGLSARQRAEQVYSWDVIGKQMISAYARIAD